MKIQFMMDADDLMDALTAIKTEPKIISRKVVQDLVRKLDEELAAKLHEER